MTMIEMRCDDGGCIKEGTIAGHQFTKYTKKN